MRQGASYVGAPLFSVFSNNKSAPHVRSDDVGLSIFIFDFGSGRGKRKVMLP